MMIQTPHTIAGAMLALSTIACPPAEPTLPNAPQPKLPCTTEVVYIDSLDSETDCDLIPPQMLVSGLDDDPTGNEELRCHDARGKFLYIRATDQFFCIDLDY